MSEPDASQEQLIDQWADRIHYSGLSVFALPILEIGRGLGFLASQALLLTQPLLRGVVDDASLDQYITLLEDSNAMERLIERIERKTRGDG